MRFLLKGVIAVAISIGFISCSQDDEFNPQGGELPSTYVFLKDSTLDPESVVITRGGSVLFVNQSGLAHTLRSSDTAMLETTIAPGTSYFFKPDTIVTVPINVDYHCTEHPFMSGMINIRP